MCRFKCQVPVVNRVIDAVDRADAHVGNGDACMMREASVITACARHFIVAIENVPQSAKAHRGIRRERHLRRRLADDLEQGWRARQAHHLRTCSRGGYLEINGKAR